MQICAATNILLHSLSKNKTKQKKTLTILNFSHRRSFHFAYLHIGVKNSVVKWNDDVCSPILSTRLGSARLERHMRPVAISAAAAFSGNLLIDRGKSLSSHWTPSSTRTNHKPSQRTADQLGSLGATKFFFFSFGFFSNWLPCQLFVRSNITSKSQSNQIAVKLNELSLSRFVIVVS